MKRPFLFTTACVSFEAGGPPDDVARLLGEAARAWRDGDHVHAREALTAAVALDETPAARIEWGSFLARQGEDALAAAEFASAWRLCRMRGDVEGATTCATNLTLLYQQEGRWDEASRYEQFAVDACTSGTGESQMPAALLFALAQSALHRDDRCLAFRYLQAAREAADGESVRGEVLGMLGVLALLDHDFEAAQASFHAAFRVHRHERDRRGEVVDLIHLGITLRGAGRIDEAVECFQFAATQVSDEGWEPVAADICRLARQCRRIQHVARQCPELN